MMPKGSFKAGDPSNESARNSAYALCDRRGIWSERGALALLRICWARWPSGVVRCVDAWPATIGYYYKARLYIRRFLSFVCAVGQRVEC